MAKGRMINNKIVLDKKIHNLSSDTCRLAFTWAITFADKEGRIHGDPMILRSMLFPRRTDITDEQMQTFIQEWAAQDLITWYEAEDDLWIQFAKFEDNQIGLRKDREADSIIPAPPVRSESGVSPEQIPVNRTEINLKEQNVSAVATHYENNIGSLTPSIKEKIIDACEEFSLEWIIEAIDIAVESNVRTWRYVMGILNNWKTRGKDSRKSKVVGQTVGGQFVEG